jgi:agmatine deiminase
MIPDRETNLVYLSDLLESKCPNVFKQLTNWFEKFHIAWDILPNTKDIWAVDFMPIQLEKDHFIQFKYDPDYLKLKKYQRTRTNSYSVCDQIGIAGEKANIILDGGNVVRCKNKVILTDKIFKENPGHCREILVAEIKTLLQVDQVIIIPQEPGDFVGHADGMVRFIDNGSVLVNQYPSNKKYHAFNLKLRSLLTDAGLQCHEIPYTAWQNSSVSDATGCYVNFLETGNYIFYPEFLNNYDLEAQSAIKSVFKDRELIKIDCRELAQLGGVLNCATWNIVI